MYSTPKTPRHRAAPMAAPKIGLFLITVHFVIYYWAPYLFGLPSGFQLLDFLNGAPNFHWGFLFSVAFYGAFLALYMSLPPPKPKPRPRPGFRLYDRSLLNLALAVPFVLLSARFALDYGLQFRQTGPSLSESGSYVIVLLVLQVYFSIYAVFQFGMILKGVPVRNIHRLIYAICIAAFLLSLTSSFTMAIVVLYALFLAPGRIQRMLLLSRGGAKGFFQGFLLAPPLMLLLVSVYLVGTANKIGWDNAIGQLFEPGYWGHFADTILYRISLYFYSLSYHISYTTEHTANALTSLRILWDSNEFRISQVIGSSGYKPDVTSINRLNNLAIFPTQNDRTGSSPGLLGSAFYTPIYPVSVLFLMMYLVWICRMTDEILNGRLQMSPFGALLVLMIVGAVWDAPINNLILLNTPFLKLLFLFLCWLNVRGLMRAPAAAPGFVPLRQPMARRPALGAAPVHRSDR